MLNDNDFHLYLSEEELNLMSSENVNDKELEKLINVLITQACLLSNMHRPWNDNNYGRAATLLSRLLPLEHPRNWHNGGVWKGKDRIDEAVQVVMYSNPDKVEQVKENYALIGWFVGQAMKYLDGKADAQAVHDELKYRLGV